MMLINPKNKKNFDRDQFIKDYEELKSACRMAEKYKCCKKLFWNTQENLDMLIIIVLN